jgi:uncharacterized protein (DUF934 family)
MLNLDKDTIQALELGRAIGQVVKQAVFLLISLGFVAYMLSPFRDAMTAFSQNFSKLTADVAAIKAKTDKMDDCAGAGRVAQAHK